MPANLTHQFHRAQARYRAATELHDQLDALQEMLREIPKHKGTEHLQAESGNRKLGSRGTVATYVFPVVK